MADSPLPSRVEMRERNEQIIADYRANGGRPSDRGMPPVVITTTGAKTGNLHTTPVCVRDEDGVLVVAGSMGGMRKHRQWYPNLQADPELTLEYLGETYRACQVADRAGAVTDWSGNQPDVEYDLAEQRRRRDEGDPLLVSLEWDSVVLHGDGTRAIGAPADRTGIAAHAAWRRMSSSLDDSATPPRRLCERETP